MRSKKFDDAFARLAAAEEQFYASEFLAPVVAGGAVQVRIAGVVNRLRVSPADYRGYGVFRVTSPTEATFVRNATLSERMKYLQLFPLVRLILCERASTAWLALAAHRGDARIKIDGPVPVLLVSDAQQFEVIKARFDGANFWFEALEPSRDPATAAYLRQQLQAKTEPNLLARPGLTYEERLAYAVHFAPPEEAEQVGPAETPEDAAQRRLRAALRHAGAELVDYLERGDSYRVTYTVGGAQHVSAVNKDDLSVQVAGICLSGEDAKFDLASLVGVLREADDDYVPRVGEGGIEENHYWRVHPPRR
jgi:hypothetical protein